MKPAMFESVDSMILSIHYSVAFAVAIALLLQKKFLHLRKMSYAETK